MRYRPPVSIVLIGIFFCTAITSFAQTPQEAIDLALAHDNDIAAARAGTVAAEYGAQAAAYDRLPQLSLGSSYQYRAPDNELDLTLPTGSTTMNLSRKHNMELSAGLHWLLFSGFAVESNIEQQRLQSLLADNALQSTELDVAFKTISAYRNVQATQLQHSSLASGRERARIQFEQVEHLREQGMANEVDLLSLKLALLDYDRQLMETAANIDNARLTLETLTGSKTFTVRQPLAQLPSLVVPELHIEQLYQMQAFRIRQEMARNQQRLTASAQLPTFSVDSLLHYGKPGTNSVEDEWMFYGTIGLSLNWSCNWGGNRLASAGARAAVTQADANSRAVRQQLEQMYKEEVRRYISMDSELAILKQAFDVTSKKMEIIQVQYKEGMASVTDFNDANLALTQAELRYRSQILAILLELNRIEMLSGKPIEQWSVSQ
ncbi:TolC family protein [Sediminispirochaeta bajacaliforniensis]|uniref:TolC family protein n=1 Tax=Sediminispirochaeta bajacaliforniensis TaxID=148 RepID=UPI0003A8295C|nr:TolC family protein [Sediminispirochaeta bajacaliforniensis]